MSSGLAEGYARAGQFLELGLRFGLAIVLGAWGGWKLDQLWGTRPWMMLLLLVASFAAAFYWLMLRLKAMQQQAEEEERPPDES